MVENAAAYFEGKETAEAIEDKALSWERYHRNSNLLKEIFDGVEPQEKRVKLTVDMKDLGGLIGLDKDKVSLHHDHVVRSNCFAKVLWLLICSLCLSPISLQ